MNKSTLKAEFINAKIKDAKYIGVSIKTEGSSQPEIIINPRENFDAKFDYYMEAFMLWTERRWSEQSATFTSPENRSMYNSSSYKSIQTKKEDGIRKRVSSLCYNGFMNVLEFWQSTHLAKLLNS